MVIMNPWTARIELREKGGEPVALGLETAANTGKEKETD
jgi:hypothetical protein